MLNLTLPVVRPAKLLPVAICAALVPAVASADEPTTLDQVKVTGSRLRAADAETRQPILVVSRDDIARQGFTSVADVLQNLSSAGAPAISRADALASGENVGGYYVNIRNLGAARTLVLLNGRRLGATTAGLQDLGQIPMSMVQRIEVLKDGASAVYGSDAIAAVVNVITDAGFDGLEVNVSSGQFSQGDGGNRQLSLRMGAQGPHSGITVALEHAKDDPVWAKDRWFSRDGNAGPDYRGSGWSAIGRNGSHCNPCSSTPGDGITPAWWTLKDGGDPARPGDYRRTDDSDRVNANEQMMVQTGVERRSLFATGWYDLSDTVRLEGEAMYNQRITDQQVAGYPLQYTLPADSPFNPYGVDTTFNRRLWEVPRTTRSDLQTFRVSGALKGSVQLAGRVVDWDVGGLHNRNQLNKTGHGDASYLAMARALSPDCGTAKDIHCTPWNPLLPAGASGPGSLSAPGLQNFLFPFFTDTGTTSTTSYTANLVSTLFDLPAGEVGVAVGYEHRREQGRFVPDAFRQSGESTGLAATTTQGRYSLDEFYAELNVPILKDLPFARELSLSLAARHSDYSNFGQTLNTKFGLTWRSLEELLVRGTVATGFRAPTIDDLHGGAGSSFESYTDPCGVGATNSVNGNAACNAAGVPIGYTQQGQGGKDCTGYPCQTPDVFTNQSNPNLKPETSTSRTVGLVWSPRWVEGLDISLDWYQYRIDNLIIQDSVDRILRDCYVLGNASRCDGISRAPDGHIDGIVYGLANLGRLETEGYDLGVNYRLPELAVGQIRLDWQSSYVSRYDEQGNNAAGETIMIGMVGTPGIFRVRSTLGVDWKKGDWGLRYGVRYYSGMKESCVPNRPCTAPDHHANGEPDAIRKVGSNTFHDLQVRWSAPWNATVSLGANNLFNHRGPIMFSSPESAFPYYGGFDIGRMVYMKYQQRF